MKTDMPTEIWVRGAQCGKNSRGERLSAVEEIPSNTRDHGRIRYIRADHADHADNGVEMTDAEIEFAVCNSRFKMGLITMFGDNIPEFIQNMRSLGIKFIKEKK